MFLIPDALAETVEATLAPTVAPAATEAPSALSSFLSTAFGKFGKFEWTTWLILAVLVLLGIILLVAAKSRKKWTAKVLAYGALSIALSFVLSYIRLYRMPQGGSITPASMLPLLLFSAAFGAGPGVLAGFAYGILQYLQGGDFLNIWQFLLDYPIAFAALGLAGLYKYLPKKWGLAASMFIAVLGRAISAVCAGLIWVAEYPVEGQLPFIYSVTYNATYLVPELIICMVVGLLIGERILKIMKAQ